MGKEITKKRDSNLELFRIIAMLLIIAHHYVVNSGLTDAKGPIFSNPTSLHSLYLLLIGAWGKVGLNGFVLISGYFMCKSNITAKKYAKLVLEVLFYWFLIKIIFSVTGYATFSLVNILRTFIPVKSVASGFTEAYLVFFLFIPFLNILVQNMNERQHVKLLLLCGFLYVFLGTVPTLSVTMNYVSWFMVLYFIASYIRLYPKKIFSNCKFWGLMLVVFMLISAGAVVADAFKAARTHGSWAYSSVSDANKFLAVADAICAFLFFKNLKVKYNKLINIMGGSTFGVLQLHASLSIVRKWLWKDTLNNVGMYKTSFGYIHVILAVLGIFIVCTCIDVIRINLLEKPFFKLWDKKWDGFYAKYKRFSDKVCKKFNIMD